MGVQVLRVMIVLLAAWGWGRLYAQTTDSVSPKAAADSNAATAGTQRQAAPKPRQEAVVQAIDTLLPQQLEKLKDYSAKVNNLSSWLRRGLDTAGVSAELNQLKIQLANARSGVLEKNNYPDNLVNLKSSEVIIESINRKLNAWQQKIDGYARRTYEAQAQIYSLRYDTVVKQIPTDADLAAEYQRRIAEIRAKVTPAAKQVRVLAVKLGLLQNDIAELQLETRDDLDELNYRMERLSTGMHHQAFPWFMQPAPGLDVPFAQSVSYSNQKTWFTYWLYFVLSTGTRLWVWLGFVAVWWLIWSGIRSLRRRGHSGAAAMAPHVTRHPFWVALFIAYSFGQFYYVHPPVIFVLLFSNTLLVIGTLLFWRNMHPYRRKIWLAALPLIVVAAWSNLLLQTSYAERWLTLLLSLGGFVPALIWQSKIKQQAEPTTLPLLNLLLKLFIIQQGVSLVCNISGRFTLAKIMMTGGYANLVSAICLWWLVLLLLELVYLLLERMQSKASYSPYFNFQKIKEGAGPFFKIVAVLLWVVLFLKNLNLYDLLRDEVFALLEAPRAIGNFSFTYFSILIFFMVLYLAVLISKMLNFILANEAVTTASGGRYKFGGAVLLLRLTVLSLGFLLAIAAAGIPLDRITIILGALGVGIGFGLQNIVSNLVSGIIIAFERPIHVGDQIEVGGRLGKVMEIGIRSSKLGTFEGAEVIIPNGDLLNQHLVNWTLSSNHRRVEIVVGVRYGTALEQARQLLHEVLKQEEKIMPVPAPAVLLHEFGASSINFRLLFWCSDIADWLELKSRVIAAIDEQFKAHGIEIPYPQQDIYIKSMPGSQ